MATFTAVGQSTSLVLRKGQVIAVSISGTYAATTQLVKSTTGGANWVDVPRAGPFAEANATIAFNYTADEDQLVALLCRSYTSGTLTYTLTPVRTNVRSPEDNVAVIEVKATAAGTAADTALTTLATGTIPAGTLKNVGDTVHILAAFRTGATANNKTLHLKVGATTFASAAAGHNAKVGILEAWVTKSGFNTQELVCRGQVSTTVIEPTRTALTETEGADIPVLAQGTNGTAAANDIVFTSMIARYIPVPKELL